MKLATLLLLAASLALAATKLAPLVMLAWVCCRQSWLK